MNASWLKVLEMGMAIAGLAILVTVLTSPREPTYRGQSLSFWVRENQSLSNGPNARRAIPEIGSDGIPFLRSAAAHEDSALKRLYRGVWPLVPKALQRKLVSPENRIDVLRRIASAYGAIGPAAIPSLARMFHDRDGGVCVNALLALAGMSGEKTSAVPTLAGLLANSDSGPAPGNPWAPPGVKQMAATVLGQIGPGAVSAIPELTRLLSDTNAHARAQATLALWRITDDPKYVKRLISDFEGATTPDAVDASLNALGEMGSAAIVALPAIRKKFKGQELSGNILDATLKIDPDAVLRNSFP